MIAETRGGPPTVTWKRDGKAINSRLFGISLSLSNYMDVSYISKLTIHGIQPGRYEFSVTNRLAITTLRCTTILDGNQVRKSCSVCMLLGHTSENSCVTFLQVTRGGGVTKTNTAKIAVTAWSSIFYFRN